MPSVEAFRDDPDARVYEPGAIIFEQNQEGSEMFVVLEGEVELRRNGRTLEIVGPGGVFGEMALVDRQPRSASATAKTAVRLAPISPQRFLYLVQNTPYFAVEVLQTMARRLRRMDEH